MTEPDDEESMAERFETVHEHLSHVDRTLDDMADEINGMVEEILAESSFELSYDLDTGSFQGQLPFEEVAARLNERLDPPFLARVDGSELVIEDIRRMYEIDGFEGREPETELLRDLIQEVEDQHDDGVPVERLIPLARSIGFPENTVEDEITQLKRQGEVYEPKKGRLRLT